MRYNHPKNMTQSSGSSLKKACVRCIFNRNKILFHTFTRHLSKLFQFLSRNQGRYLKVLKWFSTKMDCSRIMIGLNNSSKDCHNYYNKVYKEKIMSLLHNHDPKHIVSDKYSFLTFIYCFELHGTIIKSNIHKLQFISNIPPLCTSSQHWRTQSLIRHCGLLILLSRV